MSTQTVADIKQYAVDASHSRIGFSVRHMGFTRVRGQFGEFEADLAVDPSDLSTLEANARIKTASITTGEPKRDDHLRSADFFNAEKNPVIEFRSSGVTEVNGNRFKLQGDLTMNGITKAVELDAEFSGEGVDPWGGTRVAFEASKTINRKDFGLNWNTILETGGVLVSEDVKIELQIQAVEQSNDEA